MTVYQTATATLPSPQHTDTRNNPSTLTLASTLDSHSHARQHSPPAR